MDVDDGVEEAVALTHRHDLVHHFIIRKKGRGEYFSINFFLQLNFFHFFPLRFPFEGPHLYTKKKGRSEYFPLK